jgi:hypothetical protein
MKPDFFPLSKKVAMLGYFWACSFDMKTKGIRVY